MKNETRNMLHVLSDKACKHDILIITASEVGSRIRLRAQEGSRSLKLKPKTQLLLPLDLKQRRICSSHHIDSLKKWSLEP